MNSKQTLQKIAHILGLTPQVFFEAKTDQGITMKMEGELELGSLIYVATEEGLIPAPAGEHMLEDGTKIEVDEESKIQKIDMGIMEDKEEDKEEKEEEIEEMFADVKLKDGDIMRVEGDEPTVGLLTKKVSYDGALLPFTDGSYETADGKIISIVGGEIQGIKEKGEDEAFTEQEDMEAEKIAEMFSQALKNLETKIDMIISRQNQLENKVQKFAKEPAGERVFTQKTIVESRSDNDPVEAIKRLRAAMNKN